MDRETAKQLCSLVREHLPTSASFSLEEEYATPLVGFHPWADNNDCVGAFRVSSDTAELNLLLIQWSSKHPSRFVVVVYETTRTRVLFEAHEIHDNVLRWIYIPKKQDGRNPERKQRFTALALEQGLPMLGSHVSIPVPENASEVERFLTHIFLLARVRNEAHDFSQQSTSTPIDSPVKSTTKEQPQFWLMAPGPGAKYWDECRSNGFVCLGWDEKGDIGEYESRESLGLGKHDSLACWQFCHEMKPGDTIFAKFGRSAVLGHGTVTSAYRFDPSRPEFKNVRDVDWHSNFPGGAHVRDKPLVTKTLTNVSRYSELLEDLKRAVGFDQPGEEVKVELGYSIESILEDGCFLERHELDTLLSRLKMKKNLILQGPPGTGKTWLAKRLAYALIGRRDREQTRTVQFHPNLSYEDFVLGWRPSKNGLELTDGIFLRAIKSASSNPNTPFVVVIEEINRGNPSQIFGELITLLESDKRSREEALELSYNSGDEPLRVHVPENLYVIGTMNIADRSLALVDLALRRRFAFVTLKPRIDAIWHAWVTERIGINANVANEIQRRMAALNETIAQSKSLGEQYCVGHSYVTPSGHLDPESVNDWFREVVETELSPLLEEYWFDDIELAKQERDLLLKDW